MPELDKTKGILISFIVSESEEAPPEFNSGCKRAASTSEGAYLFPQITEGPGGDQTPDGGATGKHINFAERWPKFHTLGKQPTHIWLWQTWTWVDVSRSSGDTLNLLFEQKTVVGPSTFSAEAKRGSNCIPLIILVCLA